MNILIPKTYYIRLKLFFCPKIALQILFCVTLRTIIDNYVRGQNEKIYACLWILRKFWLQFGMYRPLI